MSASLTDTLCTRCGLCCDGSLFADVELAGRAETARMEVMGLGVEHEGRGLLVQPCAALAGTRCSIYAHRPGCCRTFECRLLQGARRGEVSVEQACARIDETLVQIGRVKQLLAQLGEREETLPLKERCAEALAAEGPATPEVMRKRAELESAMCSVETSIHTTFLGGRERALDVG